MKKKNEKEDLFFKNLSSAYTDKASTELEMEFKEFEKTENNFDFVSLDIKTKAKTKKAKQDKIRRVNSILLPVAVCILILFLFPLYRIHLNVIPNEDTSSNISQIADYDFIALKLPVEYKLINVDYDLGQAIYYIKNKSGNDIILTVEKYNENNTDIINKEGFENLVINDTDVYTKATQDYCILKYKKDNLLYIITSQKDYNDLIILTENLI